MNILAQLLRMLEYKWLMDIPKTKSNFKKFYNFGCQGYFCQPVFTLFGRKVNFWLNSYLDWHHLQGVWNLPHKFHLYLIQCY